MREDKTVTTLGNFLESFIAKVEELQNSIKENFPEVELNQLEDGEDDNGEENENGEENADDEEDVVDDNEEEGKRERDLVYFREFVKTTKDRIKYNRWYSTISFRIHYGVYEYHCPL
jgi:hypothetical protein